MNNRTESLLNIRPEITNVKIFESMTFDENFQNSTLRPVIKLQNMLLVAVFRNYILKHKNSFHQLAIEKRLLFIENAIQKDIKFRNAIKGMIIGQFTVEEYSIYIQNSSALNKRMMQMVIERLKDQVQLLEVQEVLP
ncbi:glyoxalase [Aurantibacter crassamenti]|uniref:glyoxalase n=1 Tax=Aurantibacter crassamenti TaxID=1837375 RepID=UPI00193A0590|nr:glyoxalase [Aurantibacter crassamenti]MBM1107086.1 glyoxalase [Aurantibacter crassamenti]